MKHFGFLILVLFVGIGANATTSGPQIKVAVDFESARIITGLLAGKHVTDAQLTQAAEAFGSKQLIAKSKAIAVTERMFLRKP